MKPLEVVNRSTVAIFECQPKMLLYDQVDLSCTEQLRFESLLLWDCKLHAIEFTYASDTSPEEHGAPLH